MSRIGFMSLRLSLVILIILGPLALPGQDTKEKVISVEFSNTGFDQFATQLKQQYNISIIYKQEWVKDIQIEYHSDSTKLSQVLSDILSPYGLKYFLYTNSLYYLTGTVKVSRELESSEALPQDIVLEEDEVSEEEANTPTASTIIMNRVVLGNNDRVRSGIASISGRVNSSSNGEPVIGATVLVIGTNNAVITDKDGFFLIREITRPDIILQFSCLGMKRDSVIVDLRGNGSFNFEMEEQLIAIQDVVVKAGIYDNVRGIQMGFQKIDIKAISSIPVVMGEKDIMKVAQMLPGVQSVGEGSSGFNVRGSSTDQNLFIINDIPVLNTGHLMGFFSSFNPDMVNDFNLYKNNFPAEFGGRLSSVFEISTRKGNKKEFGARGAISPVTASLVVETPIIKDKLSIVVGGRSTYSNWILSRVDNHDVKTSKASFYDFMTSLHYVDGKNSLQLFGYLSNDEFLLSGFNDHKYKNEGASAIYNRRLNEEWNLKIAAVISNYTNRQSNIEFPNSSSTHQFKVNSKELKFKLTTFSLIQNKINLGGSIIYHDLDHGVYSPLGELSLLRPINLGQEQGIEASLFLDDEFSITDKLTLYVGLRYSNFSYRGPGDIVNYQENSPYEAQFAVDTTSYRKGEYISGNSAPEYRFSFNYRLKPDMSLKFSFNRMYQYIFMLTNTVAVSPTDRWKLVDPYIDPPVSDQLSLGYYRNYNRFALETSAEIYAKRSRNIVEYRDGADIRLNPSYESIILNGDQEVIGAEFMVKRNAGRLTGWMSYTYSRSMITVDSENEWETINNGVPYHSNYDKPHSFVAVGNYKISRRLNVSANFVYNTGRPITYPSGIIYLNGKKTFIYSNRNEFRIPAYIRSDLAVSLEGNLKKQKITHGTWMFSVYNLTGRRNAYSIYFREFEGKVYGYKLSIFGAPIFTVSYSFKLGNYTTE